MDEQERNKKIAQCCLKTMRSHLRRDICHVTDPGVLRVDINPVDIRHYLPAELEYSCRYWIEAMSLLGRISEVIGMLDLFQRVTVVSIE